MSIDTASTAPAHPATSPFNRSELASSPAAPSTARYSVAAVAELLQLKPKPNGKWEGAPNGTDATKDGFILCPEGNAFTNRGTTYTSREVAKLAGIHPDEYEPCVQWREGQEGHGFNGYSAPAKMPDTARAASQTNKVPPAALPSQKTKAKRPKAPFNWEGEGTTIYEYREGGELLFQVGRCDAPNCEKSISQRRPYLSPDGHASDGRGGWIYGLGAGWYKPTQRNGETQWYWCKDQKKPEAGAREFPECRRVLYHEYDVIGAQIVYICEGEKAADALNEALSRAGRYGTEVATTNPHGAGKWKPEYSCVFASKAVAVLPDNDGNGRTHAETVCKAVAPFASTVRVVELKDAFPDLPEKGDIADFLEAGRTLDELDALYAAAPEWKPAADTLTAPEGIKAPRFPLLTLQEVFSRPSPLYLVKDFLIEGTTALLSADYGGFKSFLTLDLGLCVATGKAWQGREVKTGTVVYIAAEGSYTTKPRAKAWLQYHQRELPPNFRLIEVPAQIGSPAECAHLIEELRAVAPALVVVDTVAKTNAGNDENDATAIGRYVAGMDAIARELGACVLAVHHNNKGGTTRGSVALPAGVDTHIILRPAPENVVTVECDKQKGAPFEPFSLRGRVVELPDLDEYGRNVTSLVFEPTDAPAALADFHNGRAEGTREKVLQILNAAPDGLTTGDWQRACVACKPSVSSSNFYIHRKKLLAEGVVREENGFNKRAV